MSTEFPFIGNAGTTATENLKTFKEYAWDFDTDNFILDGNGNMIVLEGNDALKVWIIKALRTERYNYLAYSWRYGSEIKRFISRVMGVGERRSELRRNIIETLMVNPYIKAIKSIEFTETSSGKDLRIDIVLETVYGELAL